MNNRKYEQKFLPAEISTLYQENISRKEIVRGNFPGIPILRIFARG